VNDLTEREQRNVRIALRFLRLRTGAWKPIAQALGVERTMAAKVAHGVRLVTAGLALRLARFLDVPFDELLAGTWLSARTCPFCGHPPEDFEDEATVVEDEKRTGLTVIEGGKK